MEREDVDLKERTAGQWWYSDEETVVAPVAATRAVGERLLQAVGATADEAEFLFEPFLDKAIQGDHTRGLIDFPSNIQKIASGAPLQPEVVVLQETPSSCLLDTKTDGKHWFHNMLLARAGMDHAIKRARETGIGLTRLRVPLVIPTVHMKQAINASMVGASMTQCYPMVAPLGGYTPELGNAPVAFGVPAGKHDPVIVDMSLTNTSSSGVKQMAMRELPVPEGFILDQFGRPTTNAADYPAKGHEWHGLQRSRGTLTALGNAHKGYSLIFMVGLLSSLLTDTSYPWEAPEVSMGIPFQPGQSYGSLLIAIDPACLGMDLDFFRAKVDGFIEHITTSPRREGATEILYPGQKSQRLQRERKAHDAFSVPKAHYEAFLAIAREYGIS